MSTSKPRRINGLFVLVATVGLVFASAGPAAATHNPVTGSGTNGTGWELGPNYDEFCTNNPGGRTAAVHFETTYYTGTHASSTYVVYDHNGSPKAYYSGATTYNIQHGDMVSFPQGSEPAQGCSTATGIPTEIPLTSAQMLGNASGGSVSCLGTNIGTYLRVNNDITIRFKSTCTIKGNQGSLTATVTGVPIWHTVTGTQTPCYQLPNGCTNGEAGAELGTAFTITGNTS